MNEHMKEFYIYAVQVNVGLLLFYLLYRILFSRDTFFLVRRLFLFTIIFCVCLSGGEFAGTYKG